MIIFANNAVTTLADPLLNSQTTLTVLATTGELFPVPGVGEYFKLTLEDRRNRTIEITHCTGRAGDVLTIVRAQEDTLALNFAVGSTVANRFTRDSADAIIAQVTPANPWYLGPFAVAPTLDNEGGPLVAGMQYFNTTNNIFYVWTGASWVGQNSTTNAVSSVSGTYMLQDPSAGFNGVTTDFNLRYIDYAAAAQTPDVTIAEQFLVFLDGVRAKPGDDYTIPVLGTIHFVVPPPADQSFTGVWVAVTDGAGSVWFTGTGAPAGGLGAISDLYLDDITGDVYQKTGVATWTLVTNIQGPSGAGTGDMLKAVYDPDADGKVVSAVSADTASAAPWAGLTGVPATFPPSAHAHPESEVTGLVADLALKAPLASPAFTGVPVAPTPAPGVNTTQLATTAFVEAVRVALINGAPAALDTLDELAAALGDDPAFSATIAAALALKAPLASPSFTGVPVAPTGAPGLNTTQLATTAFVEAARVILAAADALKANLASPAFTGVPTAPNAAPGTNTTQLATTAFVEAARVILVAADALKAPLASPALTGNPTTPTAAPGDNDTSIASTAFVTAAIAAAPAGPIAIVTASDQTLPDTVLASVTGFTFAMAANTSYLVRARIYATIDTTGGIRFSHSGPASPTSILISSTATRHGGAGTITPTVGAVQSAVFGSLVRWSSASGIAAASVFDLEYVIHNGANAGTWQMQAAQETNNDATIIKANSSMTYQVI